MKILQFVNRVTLEIITVLLKILLNILNTIYTANLESLTIVYLIMLNNKFMRFDTRTRLKYIYNIFKLFFFFEEIKNFGHGRFRYTIDY